MPCARISGIWNSLSKCSSAVIQQNTRVRRQSAGGIAAGGDHQVLDLRHVVVEFDRARRGC